MNNKYSFKEFLTSDVYVGKYEDSSDKYDIIDRIEIPMIQRDYAQGRSSNPNSGAICDTGSKFVKFLFKAIKNNEEKELEFIYGSVEERDIPNSREKLHVFIPLDGQQRLTTLFLLYWYFGVRELSESELKEHMKMLSKFTYLTRASSRTFCECLCNFEKISKVSTQNVVPSKTIENMPWFFKDYKKDPTVKSMLRMIDYISSQYDETLGSNENTEDCTHEKYISRLENLRFYPFSLDKFKLSEDLYIKMNARGKQLTDYENFKADLINWMKLAGGPFVEESVYSGRTMNYCMAISQKMDNEWTDILWSAVCSEDSCEDSKGVDSLFMRIFYRYFYFVRVLSLRRENESQDNKMSDDEIKDDIIAKYFYGDDLGNDEYIAYSNNDFEEKYKNILSYDIIRDFEMIFDRICNNKIIEIINREFTPSWQKEEGKNIAIYSENITLPQRIVLLAIFRYFLVNETFDETYFCDWIRVCWNFATEPMIRNIKDGVGAFAFIEKLSCHSNNILKYLATDPEPSRYKKQFEEECFKAKLVLKDRKWAQLLIEGESHPLLKGRIACLLPNKELTSDSVYCQYKEACYKIIPKGKKDYLWIRAILAQIEALDLSSYSNCQLNLSNERENWRASINDNLKAPTQSLLAKVAAFIESNNDTSINEYLQSICKEYTLNGDLDWLYPLVTWEKDKKSLLDDEFSKSKRIGLKEGGVYLYYKQTLAGESSILLSGLRNKLISSILAKKNCQMEWTINSYSGNIDNKYFRGKDVILLRETEDIEGNHITVRYLFNLTSVVVGIKKTDAPHFVSDSSSEDGDSWLCKIEYLYNENKNNEESIAPFIEKIETDVFDLSNSVSLLNSVREIREVSNDI